MLWIVDSRQINISTEVFKQPPREFAVRHLFAVLDARQAGDAYVAGGRDSAQRLLPGLASFSEIRMHEGEFA